jgi:hypothetical protein
LSGDLSFIAIATMNFVQPNFGSIGCKFYFLLCASLSR